MSDIADWIHRCLTGQTVSPTELRVAGVIIMAWFLMDFAQWIDWLLSKFP